MRIRFKNSKQVATKYDSLIGQEVGGTETPGMDGGVYEICARIYPIKKGEKYGTDFQIDEEMLRNEDPKDDILAIDWDSAGVKLTSVISGYAVDILDESDYIVGTILFTPAQMDDLLKGKALGVTSADTDPDVFIGTTFEDAVNKLKLNIDSSSGFIYFGAKGRKDFLKNYQRY